jgi:leucyl aminopeptidase (aminopeptidase T)
VAEDREIDETLLPGARRLVHVNAAVKPGETAVILSDTQRPASIRRVLVHAIEEVGATPIEIVTPPIPSGAEPPAAVAAALAAADVIFAPTSGAVYHTAALRAAAARGARFLAMTAYIPEVLLSGGIFADFPTLAPRALRLTELLTAAHEARVTAPGGTDLRVRLDGRTAVPITGMARAPGERTGCPDIESFIAPLETASEGVVVVDASASIAGVLTEPLRITVAGGKAVAIEGAAAGPIVAALEATGHPHARTLAELAFGLNPEGIIRGVIVEDEGVAGTGHVALGSNVFFGGTSAPPIHLDFVYHKPTLRLDGRVIIAEGELTPTFFGA